MCKERNDKLNHYVLHLPRKDCILLVRILTDHCLAASHATTLGIQQPHLQKMWWIGGCWNPGTSHLHFPGPLTRKKKIPRCPSTGITRRRLQQETRRTFCLRQKHLDLCGHKNLL